MRKEARVNVKKSAFRGLRIVSLLACLLSAGCMTPLEDASSRGDVTEVRRLLDQGADLKKWMNAPPLIAAAENGNTACAKLLLDRGADVNGAAPSGWTALMCASANGRTETVQLLLERGANMETATAEGATPLLLAAESGKTDVVRLLLDKGAKLEAKNNDSRTALIKAAREGHLETVQLLLDRGAAIEAKDTEWGQTALHFAAFNDRLAVVRLLLDRGADLDVRNNFGTTALIGAATCGYSDVVNLLLERGADPDVKNNDGWTAHGIANANGWTGVANTIAGAPRTWREAMLAKKTAVQKKSAEEQLRGVSMVQLLEKNEFTNEAFVAALTEKLIEAKNRELPAFIAKSTIDQRVALLTAADKRLIQAQTQIGGCNTDAESLIRQGRESEASARRKLAVAIQAYQGVVKTIQEMLGQS